MIEAFFEAVIVLFFQYPGAFIRWIFVKHKRTFKSLLDDDAYINATVSALVIAGAVLLIRFLFF